MKSEDCDMKKIIVTRRGFLKGTAAAVAASYATPHAANYTIPWLVPSSVLGELDYAGPIGLQGYGIKGDCRANLKRSITAWRKMQKK